MMYDVIVENDYTSNRYVLDYKSYTRFTHTRLTRLPKMCMGG